MRRVINKDELHAEPLLLEELKRSVFIYPTDTIYGIGCDATNTELVERIRQIKGNHDQPFSIIVPDLKVLEQYCEVDANTKQWLSKLPGPYTLILKCKKRFFSEKVNLESSSIGVRVPDNWFVGIVEKMKVPVVTTSANLRGDDFMTSLEDLNPAVASKVDMIVYDGPIKGRPSTIVHLDDADVKIRHR